MSIAAIVFVVSFLFCAYAYFGYPALLLVLRRIRPRPHRRGEHAPTLTVVIPAHNEEATIRRKIIDTMDNGYDAEKLEIIVASDGSTDDTERIAAEFGGRVRVLALPRGGKARALNAAASAATGAVIAFTDANIRLLPGALAQLMSNFADPEVGGASANKIIGQLDDAGVLDDGEGLYWRWERWQKEAETEIGSVFASDGALHAVRRELYVPIPDTAAADDIAISAEIVLRGRRLVFDPGAVALEAPPDDPGAELRRKVRVANQSIRALLELRARLWTAGFYSLQLLSHKLLRYGVPLFLLLMLASNALLASSNGGFWTLLLLGQLLFYSAAAAAALGQEHGFGRLRLLAVPYYFCLVNLAAALAILSLLRGQRSGIWEPRAGFASKGVS